MPAALKSVITGLVSGIEPVDDLGREHSRDALSWLARTDDIFRRVKPLTPSPHLVSYFLRVRWWTVQELRQCRLDGVEPHMLRALDALGLGRRSPGELPCSLTAQRLRAGTRPGHRIFPERRCPRASDRPRASPQSVGPGEYFRTQVQIGGLLSESMFE